MRHPFRGLFERLGLVRTDDELKERFAETDKVVKEGLKVAREAKARRQRLADEAWRRTHHI